MKPSSDSNNQDEKERNRQADRALNCPCIRVKERNVDQSALFILHVSFPLKPTFVRKTLETYKVLFLDKTFV